MITNATPRTDAILHPQRLQILRALAHGACTTAELAQRLADIPQATLYRHLALLLDSGVIAVTDERRVRGAVERTYALIDGAAVLTAADLARATPEDHYRYFSMFVAGLLGQFARYLERDAIDLERDGVGYRELVLHLNDDELAALTAGLQRLIHPLLANRPDGERQARLLATVLMPADAATTKESRP